MQFGGIGMFSFAARISDIAPIKNLSKRCFEYFRIAAIHCFRKRRFCHVHIVSPYMIYVHNHISKECAGYPVISKNFCAGTVVHIAEFVQVFT